MGMVQDERQHVMKTLGCHHGVHRGVWPAQGVSELFGDVASLDSAVQAQRADQSPLAEEGDLMAIVNLKGWLI